MNKYEIYNLEENEYYLVNDIYKFDKSFFYGCRNNVKNIIKKKKIDDKDIYFAYMKKGSWTSSSRRYNRAKLFISKDWVYNNVPNAFNKSEVVADVEALPPLVELNDNQKFTDGHSMYEIEMRGERDPFKSYFKAEDISKIFKFENLSRIITNKNTNYEKKNHYNFFIDTTDKKFASHQNKHKKLYLTYRGVIKVLFNSKTALADKFQDW